MKGYNYWSYKPYKAPLSNVGDPYVCRLAPSENAIHVEWLGNGGQVFFRKRNEGDYALAGETEGNELDITGLETDTDYELYVTRNGSKSRVRLFRAGKGVGGAVSGLSFDLGALGIMNVVFCILSKLMLSAVFTPIFVAVSVGARQKAWLAICGSLAVGMLLFMTVSLISPLSATVVNVILCAVGGTLFSTLLGLLSKQILNKVSLV